MKITSKGQITIPADIRQKFGLLPETDVEFVTSGDKVFLRKVARSGRRGKKLVSAMRGRATAGLSTDEVMALTRGD